jgi:hypothetical protein
MVLKHCNILAISLFVTASSPAALAQQQLYKCGATFQDKPCDTEVQKKYSSLTGSFTKEQVNANADAKCAALGVASLPIIRARANGETKESLNEKIDSKPIGRLEKGQGKRIYLVRFLKNGSESDIRGSIETDCMDQKGSARAAANRAHAYRSY